MKKIKIIVIILVLVGLFIDGDLLSGYSPEPAKGKVAQFIESRDDTKEFVSSKVAQWWAESEDGFTEKLVSWGIDVGTGDRASALPKWSEPLTKGHEAEKARAVFRMVNEERRKRGLNELIWDENLAEGARRKNLDMFKYNYYAHESPNYGALENIYYSAGVPRERWVGENIWKASGITSDWEHQISATAAHNTWMNSPGHKANILNPTYNRIGIDFYLKDGRFYGTQGFSS